MYCSAFLPYHVKRIMFRIYSKFVNVLTQIDILENRYLGKKTPWKIDILENLDCY